MKLAVRSRPKSKRAHSPITVLDQAGYNPFAVPMCAQKNDHVKKRRFSTRPCCIRLYACRRDFEDPAKFGTFSPQTSPDA
jgi:hypothetical protein